MSSPETPDVVPQGDPAPAPPPAPEIPAWAAEIQKHNKEMQKELAKLRRRLSEASEAGGDPAPAPAPAPAKPTTQDYLRTMRLAELRSGLPESAQAELDGYLEGRSLDEAEVFARALQAALQAAGKDAPRTPRGQPGAPAPATSTHPRTYAEYAQIARRARGGEAAAQRQLDALLQDETFEASRLPMR